MKKQYIYIMQKVYGGAFSPFDLLIQNCKIGVTTRPDLRIEQVDSSTRGRVVMKRCMRMFWGAYAKERLLHLLFAPVRYEAKPARGHRHASGGTEWFHLTLVGRIVLEVLLFVMKWDVLILGIVIMYLYAY